MGKLNEKVVLITGSTSGIGAATAKLFQAEGATVIVTGANPFTLETARTSITEVEVIASDASDIVAIRALIDGIRANHGRIDVLFVNAAVSRFSPIFSVDESFFDALFNINARGAYFVAKHAAEIMPDGGCIIFASSVSGVLGGRDSPCMAPPRQQSARSGEALLRNLRRAAYA